MKFVSFTHVDAITRVPVTIEPAANGPAFPEGCSFGFALESRYPTLSPVFYGTTDGKTDMAGIISVLTKADYDAAEAAEMAARAARAAGSPYANFIPIPLLRQRIEALGMWDAFAAYLAQNPAEMLKVLTVEVGVDPAYPSLGVAFDAMDVPQTARDIILAPPSAGVGVP